MIEASKLFQQVKDAFEELAAPHARSMEISPEMTVKEGNREVGAQLSQRPVEAQQEWERLFPVP